MVLYILIFEHVACFVNSCMLTILTAEDFYRYMAASYIKIGKAYIVIEENTSAEQVWNIMEEKWDMKEPSLIVSVIGGSVAFHLDERIESSFKKSIKKLSKLPNAYIITGGAYSGVMKLVGDSLELDQNSGTICLGVSTWHDIQDKEKFLEQGNSSPYEVGTWLSRNGLYLDYQHTHFLIVKEDGGKSGNGQIKFRASLEKHLRQLSRPKPSILLVVNGGFGTLQFVKEYIDQVNEKADKEKTYPESRIVLLQNSGKCASLLSKAYELMEETCCDNEDVGSTPHMDFGGERLELLWKEFKKYMVDPEDTRYRNVKWHHIKSTLMEMRTPATKESVNDASSGITGIEVSEESIEIGFTTDLTPKAHKIKPEMQSNPLPDNKEVSEISILDACESSAITDSGEASERQPSRTVTIPEVPKRISEELSDNQGPSKDCVSLLADAFRNLLHCMKRKELFTVTGLSSKVDIDTAILNSLLASEKSTFEKIRLTLLYDRADYAESEIFSCNPELGNKELKKLMILALKRGDHAYVKLLMDYGVNMHKLLTVDILEELYGHQLFEDNFLLRKMARSVMSDTEWKEHEEDQGKEVRHKLHKEHAKKLLFELRHRFVENEVEIFKHRDVNTKTFIKEVTGNGPAFQLVDPFWELFLWAVICNMPEMATFLWPFGRDQLAKALIGAEVSAQLAKVDGIYQQAALSLTEFSMNYCKKAQDLLDELSATNEELTRSLVTSFLRHVPKMTCIDIAVETKDYEFVAHTSIQMILWDMWTGSTKTKVLKPIDYLKFLLSIIFPLFLISPFKKVNSDERVCGGKTNDENRLTPVEEDPGFLTRLKNFYFFTPIVTFLLHMCGATVFLGVYSRMVIRNHPMDPGEVKRLNPCATYLVLYMVGYVVGEIYQVIQYEGRVTTKLCLWISDGKNVFDIFNCALFFLAFALSFSTQARPFSHTLYSINCGLWIIRFSLVVRVFNKLGLYFEMMTTMLVDLMWFLVILGVFVTAFGVTATSLLYPGYHEPVKYLHMFIRSWFSIYGEYFMEIETEGNSTTHLTSPIMNSYDEYVVIVVMGLYLLLTNILLLNIIIASFNTTYANIQEMSIQISKYRIYDLVLEYSRRISTPPPLSLVHHLGKVIVWTARRCMKVDPPPFPFMNKLKRRRETGSFDERLRDFEYYCALKVYKGETKGVAVTDYSDSQIQQICRKIEQLQKNVLSQMEKTEPVQTPSPVYFRDSCFF